MAIGDLVLIAAFAAVLVFAVHFGLRVHALEEKVQRLRDACDGKDITIVALARENEILKSLAEDSLQRVMTFAPYLGQKWH